VYDRFVLADAGEGANYKNLKDVEHSFLEDYGFSEDEVIVTPGRVFIFAWRLNKGRGDVRELLVYQERGEEAKHMKRKRVKET